jgi:hypothetical protein
MIFSFVCVANAFDSFMLKVLVFNCLIFVKFLLGSMYIMGLYGVM